MTTATKYPVDTRAHATYTVTVVGHERFWDFGVLHDRVTFDDGVIGAIKASIYRSGRFATESMCTQNGISRFISCPLDWVPSVGDKLVIDRYRYGAKVREIIRPAPPYVFTGVNADGYACYDEA